ncbi:hypothetical protein E8E15_009874 [Penicillium rubens]|jgi:hypothetical protein|uniref:Uncharacterized protein n=2 Tax=Penicillium chrysogenum species complex TaxID=254878 RepID=B6HUJ3_PENRW|nr:uncharacterized protein N7525_004944 [Penicillium rubens]XP_056564045.1 uncharacterized protein N7489_010674 [Penicillium chrysogenum]CAP98716.1 hypothetical protein PCH_Pc22g14280 [Penicillium rubens Wisconsin 54-1255]KAF3027482.1 hypothetical protein E8E15_009874 [Penicillium rubens]KAJ5044332.1 hypothetical protein NUH16_001133 [Penicillium rubens]KAJ5229966.1 hypothetical protein N7489_010674 [Penicillium chrysogenum]KAJ5271640.1 hypothetical protein N7524_004909 [Penicillium chrysogen
MGIISTLTRCMRKARLSKRLSTTSTKLHDEDSNDLIKTTSETASLTRTSMDSTSTMVHHSVHEPVLPCESPANRMQIGTDNGNMRTLFDDDSTANQMDRPILKLDCRSPVDAPRKVLQGPLEVGRNGSLNKATENKAAWDRPTEGAGGYTGKDTSGCSSATTAQNGFEREKGVSEKRDKRSMSALLKRHCGLNIPRSSISIKTSRSVQSPRGLDSAGFTEEEGLVDKRDEKWVDVSLNEKKRNSVWGGVGLGRLW